MVKDALDRVDGFSLKKIVLRVCNADRQRACDVSRHWQAIHIVDTLLCREHGDL